MIQSYKQKHELAAHYDAILIGSGIGSLATAVCLSKEGKRVLVLERHYTAGGYTHVFKRRGYEWDVGIHYIGEMGRERGVLKQLFDYITDAELKWADMGEVYDRIVIGENTYDFPKGVQNFKDQMKGYFPEEADAIDKYVDLVFEASRASREFYAEKAMPNYIKWAVSNKMRKAYLKFASRTTLDVLQELTSNEQLIKVLTGQYGDYGLPPSKSSFAMHASVAKHYFHGGFFPVGGSSQIADNVAPILERSGSMILTNAEVEEIIVENGKATGVKMADGKNIHADLIVSGTGIINTYTKLLPSELVRKHKMDEHLQKVKPSAAHVCLYIGLNGTPQELKLPKANYWIYPSDLNHDASIERFQKDIDTEFPVVYISFPSAKDPSWSERYPNKSTVDIITVMPYEIFQEWEDTKWKKRGDGYEALKEKFAQRLLEVLYEKEPQLRGKVDYYELSTPVSTKHFMNYAQGELYGIDHDPERYEQKFLQPRTEIKNLYLTGQDIVTAGVGGALFAGFITASAILKKNIIEKIMKEVLSGQIS
ncbi:phytoene desaturase family protein [Sediminitomix flava]|uniref:All-trans-retinol 13,14-reductase n=1 Tax=Sediminitomix flava TaxID=379075 RepID=A0A316A0M1_SEDFL|nr:NAD(P)/FAD-dependent oxidoreductase [Sediminitomix flava]PWJ43187.1 all-trans-retinol 13,14-reductase [Sediminitomix flava]